ncbi:MAG: U32 family peptidase [Coriobacteriia bacterium]|nr:U32 family peptidase [Coriobacteriia bacterium]MCL2537036.1 U32 family peptidase [Coriobacteriia bacterium]
MRAHQRPELLAPAGSIEALKLAIDCGADAVYCGGKSFGLRYNAANFCVDELKSAAEYVHSRKRLIYLTVNALIHESDLSSLRAYLGAVKDTGVDAFIVSDLGAAKLAGEIAPEIDLHVSTQASVANSLSAQTWYEAGARRIVAARELDLRELTELRKNLPEDMQLEVFVHGAQCMAISGRCIISNYLADRDANKGQCAHSCRWSYELVEKKRPNESIPVIEDDGYTTIFSPYDLNMIEHIDDLCNAGIDSLKIEGRTKGVNYITTVISAYRAVLDGADPRDYVEQLRAQTFRPQGTGFYYGSPRQNYGY